MRIARERGLPEWSRSLPWERRYLVATARWIVDHTPSSAPVLDVGCGLGQLFALLPHPGSRALTGIEARADVAAGATELLAALGIDAEIRVADAFDALPSADLRPETVVVTTNWHHAVRNGLPRLFPCVARAMRPRGVWIFDALDDPPPPLRVWYPEPDREGFSSDAVLGMAADAGLDVLEVLDCGDRTVYVVRKDR